MFMVYNYNTKVPTNNTTQHPNTVKCLREENPKSGKKKENHCLRAITPNKFH